MSGEPGVHLADSAVRLVEAIAGVQDEPIALVGGLAVNARLGVAHRVTADVDGVFDAPGDVPTAVRLVRAGVATQVRSGTVAVSGTEVDIIDTFELPHNADLPDDDAERLFVCAHRNAFDTAQPLTLSAGDATATLNVATPAALVACKAHALAFARPQRRATKRASDLYDLFRLLSALGEPDQICSELRRAPWELGTQVATALDHDVASDVASAAATLRRSDDDQIASVREEDLADVVHDFLTLLK